MFTALKTALRTTPRFARDRRGSIMLMTGVMFPVMVMLAGGVTDFTRAFTVKAKAQKTLDAAVLSMAMSDLTDAEIEGKGGDIFKGWLKTRRIGAEVTASRFVSSKERAAPGQPGILVGTATLQTPTYFLGVFGRKSLDIELASTSLKPNPLPYEIALVLDVSGSMSIDLNGRPRIDRMQEATVTLFDEIEQQSRSRTPPTISIIPYSTSVNITGIGTGILNGTSVGGAAIPAAGNDVWAAERARGDDGIDYDLSDEAPASTLIPFVTATEIGFTTPTVRVQEPSNVPATYRAAIDGLVADGNTAGHLGMIWGVYALSPAWSSVWATDPRPYGEAQKIIVMLTDGEFNTTQGLDGNAAAESDRYFQSACKLARKKGIVIYAVALSLDNVSKGKLTACTAGGGGEVFSADSADALTKAFESIAAKIGGLRLAS